MNRQTQTIESTGKFWKLLQLVGVLAMIVGMIILVVGRGDESPSQVNTGGLLLACGLPSWIIGRIGGWWFHG